MNFNDTPDEAAFRSEARAWLEATAPKYEVQAGAGEEQALAHARDWQARKADDGSPDEKSEPARCPTPHYPERTTFLSN